MSGETAHVHLFRMSRNIRSVMSTENLAYEEVEIRAADYASTDAASLIEAANIDLATRYRVQLADLGGPNTSGLQNEPSQFVPPHGRFFIAFLNGRPVGCGGWVSYGTSGEVGELKKLYVLPEARKRGIAQRILAASEGSARENGRLRMILEVGTGQPEALTLYESHGYVVIENYGYFRDIPECRSYARSL
jgi:GNAT superfamily N-acetyltransferase